VEALLSSTDADAPGRHRETLINNVQAIVRFNQEHPTDRFDGIHLDVEPQQRPENKGPENLRFLRDLADAFLAVQEVAKPAGMTVTADIQSKLLKGTRAERQMLLSAVSSVTLMMYGLSSPGDPTTFEQKMKKVERVSQTLLDIAYNGLEGRSVAKMVIALRVPDYGEQLPQALKQLDDANRANPHYLGWAWHSYNAYLNAVH
jgi:hypothetical protein